MRYENDTATDSRPNALMNFSITLILIVRPKDTTFITLSN